MLKYCAFFSLWAGVGLGADYLTYQAARLVIGQSTFTSQNAGASNTLMGSAAGVAFAANTLFVADGNRLGLVPSNNRVLVFSNITQSMPQPMAPIQPYIARCPVCLGQATAVLGQPDFTTTDINSTRSGMRTPTAVASDGQILAVADTANNRILIWNSIPTAIGQPADLVLGQPDFNTIGPVLVNASSFRAPQGVWIQDGKLYVADTENNRVMIWNSIPTENNKPADVVLGQPNFTSAPQLDLTQSNLAAAPNTMLNPVSVTSDGTHLFVADLGFNRVLIWNAIPTTNGAPANVEIGQPDMVSSTVNNSFTTDANMVQHPVLCTTATGTDTNNNPTYPAECEKTIDWPRFALSDGTRLYVADGGNDRVLVFNTIPTTNAAGADVILGQPDAYSDIDTSNMGLIANSLIPTLSQSASNLTPTPTSLAWDGTNLYVADPTDFRVLVFTPEETNVPSNGVRNAAIIEIFADGRIILQGSINFGDKVTVTICPPVDGAVMSGSCSNTTANANNYTYTIQTNDTFNSVLQALASLINAGSGDQYVFATPGLNFQFLELDSRLPGEAGNTVSLAAEVSTNALITASAATTTLVGGDTPTTIAPGSLISILGSNLADAPASAPSGAPTLPLHLGGVEVYVDGIRVPLIYVSPTQINAQMPFETIDTNSSSCYVRIQHADGSVTVTDAVGIPVDLDVPGIFAGSGNDPRPAIAFHGSSYATGLISVNGTIATGDVATVTIRNNTYTYTVQSGDTLASIVQAFVGLIDGNSEEVVTASVAPAFTNIFLQAKVAGPEGDDIAISASAAAASTAASGTSASVTMTATNSTLCCANTAGAPITPNNPAIAGETIYVLATGLGIVGPSAAQQAIVDGAAYTGPAVNNPNASVSSLAGGVSANVISAGLMTGGVGLYKIVLQLGSTTPTDPNSQVTISQAAYTSNVVTIPVYNPVPPG